MSAGRSRSRGTTSSAAGGPKRISTSLLHGQDESVSPLELFFDLVFVFAVSQLSDHLVHDLTWTGAAQTLVLLAAVFSIWAFSSFGVVFTPDGRTATVSLLVVLFLALFINAAIPRAFTTDGLPFLVPFLVARFGQVVQANVTASTAALRRHHRAVLVWVAVECALWVAGGAVPPDVRLGWWGAAAVVSIAGYWSSHVLPRRAGGAGAPTFAPVRMVERARLLLLIALGETVLDIGRALAGAQLSVTVIAAAVLALLLTALLWSLYFVVADPIVDRAVRHTTDPLGSARAAIDSQLLTLAGLIGIGVAAESSISAPVKPAGWSVALALHLGVGLYLLAQAWYLHALDRRPPTIRVIAVVALALSAPATALVSALVGLGVVCGILAAVAVASRRPRPAVRGSVGRRQQKPRPRDSSHDRGFRAARPEGLEPPTF